MGGQGRNRAVDLTDVPFFFVCSLVCFYFLKHGFSV